MKRPFLPKSTQGRWAVGLGIAFVVLIVAKIVSFMPLPTFSIAALGLVGFVLALVAEFKRGDKSIAGVLPLAVGMVIVSWTAAEIVLSH